MNKIRYLSLLMLLASSVIMLGKASPYVRLLADKTQLTVVADPPEGGTVSGGGSYEAGESVKLTAKAATGFKFVNWTRNGIEVSTESSFSYTKTNVDETLTAHFVFSPSNPAEPDEPDIKKKYVLNLLTEEGGSNVKGAGTYDEGTKVTVSVSVNTGFVFQGWYNSAGNMESDKMSFSYTVTGNETLTARFVFSPSNPDDPPQPDTTPYYVLTLLTEEGGYNVKGAGTYKEGTSVQVSVQSETGYTFLGWYDSQGEQVSDKNSFKYELNGHETLTARFAFNPDNPDDPPLPDVRPSYVLTLQTEEGGYNVKGAGTYKEGTSVQVSVQSETGYTFLGWYDSQGEQVSDKNSFKYEVNGHETLTARFRYNPGNPIEPSMSDDHRISLYVTSVKGLPGQTVDIPVYLSCQDSIADIQFQITFPAGLTIQTENVRLSGKAQDYSLSVTQTANGAAGAPHRAGTDSSYLFSITGGKLPPCNTRLVVLKVDVADDFTEESNLIVINDVMINNIDGTTTTASTQNGKMVLQTSSEEGAYYYLTLISTGNGQALVNSIAVRNSMHTFDFLEGTSANVYFTPDDGYFLANVMLEDEDVTDQVTDGNRYLLENMNKNVTMTVMFEQKEIVIPKVADVEFAQNGYLLTLSTPTEGATIHYTLSNSEAGEQVYTDVLTMTGDCIIEAWATKDSYTTSDVTRFEFHADGVTCSVPQIVRNGNKIGISTSTDQATIYYTTDGTTPTEQSTVYTDSIVVDRNSTIKAIAVRDNWFNSAVAEYNVTSFKVSDVQFAQNGNVVTLSTATANAKIFYTLSTNGNGEQEYTAPLTMTGDCTIEAYATRDGYLNSDTTSFVFHAGGVTCSNPTFARNENVITISTQTDGASIYYTIDGTDPTEQSTLYSEPITVDRNMTIKAIAMRENYYSSQVATFVVDWFKVSNVNFLQNKYKLTLTTATEGAQIWYKVTPGNDGYVRYTEVLTMSDDCIVEAYATRDSYYNSDTTRYEFFIPVADYVFDGTTLHVKSVGHMQSVLQLTGADASKTIAAIIWDGDNQLTNSMMDGIDNPNLLLYVSNKSLAPGNVKNVVVGDSINGYKAQQIVLKDTESGNGNFFCPIPFTANRITYEREFLQYTQPDSCRGWETIVLPFAVQSIMHERNGALTPFANFGEERPFWLRELTTRGFIDAAQIEANKPYIISMPNYGGYDMEYQLGGWVTFSAYACNVPKTILQTAVDSTNTIRFIPAVCGVAQGDSVYALNVGEEYMIDHKKFAEGSVFVAGLDEVRPFRCYTQHVAAPAPGYHAPRYIPLAGWADGDVTGINEVIVNGYATVPVYNLNGQRVVNPQKGLYIVNGKKTVTK